MQPPLFDFKDLNHIASQLKKGKAAVIETDTVVGLVSRDPQLLYELKNRELSKPLVTLISTPLSTSNKRAVALMAKH